MIGSLSSVDVAIVGAGAAGLAAGIFARRAKPGASVLLLEGARKPGAKILVSGGSRCNVTNVSVTEHDFWGGRPSIVRRVLRGFPVVETIRFFGEIGVRLREEAGGKLFPDSNRARDVLDALLHEVASAGATLLSGARVLAVARDGERFRVTTVRGDIAARTVVLATGGQSLPKSGSDGAGYTFARAFGHTIVPTTPALVPLVLDGGDPFPRRLAGVSHDAELTVWIDGAVATRLRGSLLWTHFGISGPVVLNASRHWLRAELQRRSTALTLSFCPGLPFEAVDADWQRRAAERPRVSLQSALASIVPSAVAEALLDRLALDPQTALAHFTRDDRRRLAHALTRWTLATTGTRGYNYAEATAGGVPLDEIDPATMESRVQPGLFLIGEILDVDGRLGGFNFQWAWSSAFAAGGGLAQRLIARGRA